MLGKDHPELGAIAVSAVSPSLAIATSAGARPKLSRIVERNEDACAVARGPRAELLAVADAHYGSTAARRAVEVVLDAFAGNVPPANLPSAELERIVFEVGSAIAQETAEPGHAQPRSRTTLAFALVTPNKLQWATFGDSIVVAGDGEEATVLGASRATYLGYSFVRAEVSALLDHGIRRRGRGEYVVVATDGLVAAPSIGLETIRTVLREGRDAEWTARRIVSLALEAGVADAVSVAVASPQAA